MTLIKYTHSDFTSFQRISAFVTGTLCSDKYSFSLHRRSDRSVSLQCVFCFQIERLYVHRKLIFALLVRPLNNLFIVQFKVRKRYAYSAGLMPLDTHNDEPLNFLHVARFPKHQPWPHRVLRNSFSAQSRKKLAIYPHNNMPIHAHIPTETNNSNNNNRKVIVKHYLCSRTYQFFFFLLLTLQQFIVASLEAEAASEERKKSH